MILTNCERGSKHKKKYYILDMVSNFENKLYQILKEFKYATLKVLEQKKN